MSTIDYGDTPKVVDASWSVNSENVTQLITIHDLDTYICRCFE